MPQIVCHIALDVSVRCTGQSIMAKQGDTQSRLLCVHLTDCGRPLDLGGAAAVLLNISSGNTAATYEGEITKEGEALFTIPDLALSKVGTVTCDVSVISPEGGRLTSAPFGIEVEAAVCPNGEFGTEKNPSMAAEFLATQSLFSLTPVALSDRHALRPALNRKYTLDLSDTKFTNSSGSWYRFALELPTPQDPAREHWVLIYCHAPLRNGQALPLILPADCLLVDGASPVLFAADMDIVCTYSPGAGKWQVGVVQYATA